MNISKVDQLNIEAYKNFVAVNYGSFLQSLEWGEWQEKNGKKAIRYIVEDETGTPILSAQFLRHALPFDKEYFYCAYGPVVNLKFKIEDCRLAIQELITKIHKDYPKTIFIRLEPTSTLPPITYSLRPSLHIQPASTILLDVTKPKEELLANMHPKTRYNIKVAEKHDVTVKQLQSKEEKQLAANLFKNTLTRRKLVSPSTDYYFELANYNTGGKNFSVNTFGAYLGDTLLACALTVDFNQTRTYLFGGSSTEHKNVMAPYLLHWTIIQDAKTQNIETYDWFGAEGAVSDGSGFARFKTGFGGTLKAYGGTYDIVFRPLIYKLYQLTRSLNRWLKHL